MFDIDSVSNRLQKQLFNFIISDSLIFFLFYTSWQNQLQMSLAYNHLSSRKSQTGPLLPKMIDFYLFAA